MVLTSPWKSLSTGDQTLRKIDFYSKVNVRELLLIDREPWELRLLRLDGEHLQEIAVGKIDGDGIVERSTCPLSSGCGKAKSDRSFRSAIMTAKTGKFSWELSANARKTGFQFQARQW